MTRIATSNQHLKHLPLGNIPIQLGWGLYLLIMTLGCSNMSESLPAQLTPVTPEYECVILETNLGDISLGLDKANAPVTVANFLAYANDSFYSGTLFHRVIPEFMIQSGGYTEDFTRKDTDEPIKNESNNGLNNERGTISMARTSDPHSATSQFFINTVDNVHLDFEEDEAWGYAVFGHVTEGMAVVDSISRVDTGPGGPFSSDAPREKVVINDVNGVACE